MIKCQACKRNDGQVKLIDDVVYEVCHNCLILLVNRDLSAKQYRNLKKIHGCEAFLLHSDFYGDDGEALQPHRGVDHGVY